MNTPTQRAHNLQIIADQNAEIERLNEVKLLLEGRIHRDYSLITELADELERIGNLDLTYIADGLVRKAREAVK